VAATTFLTTDYLMAQGNKLITNSMIAALINGKSILIIIDGFESISNPREVLKFISILVSVYPSLSILIVGRNKTNYLNGISIKLCGLNQRESREFIVKQTAALNIKFEAAVIDWILQSSEGNASIIEQLIRELMKLDLDDIPMGLGNDIISKTIGSTLNFLNQQELRTLELLALIGNRISLNDQKNKELFYQEGIDSLDENLCSLINLNLITHELNNSILIPKMVRDYIVSISDQRTMLRVKNFLQSGK